MTKENLWLHNLTNDIQDKETILPLWISSQMQMRRDLKR